MRSWAARTLEVKRSRQGSIFDFPTRLHPFDECGIDFTVSTSATKVSAYTLDSLHSSSLSTYYGANRDPRKSEYRDVL